MSKIAGDPSRGGMSGLSGDTIWNNSNTGLPAACFALTVACFHIFWGETQWFCQIFSVGANLCSQHRVLKVCCQGG